MGVNFKDLLIRVGTQADRTTKAASVVDFPIPADGDGLAGDIAVEELDTEHGTPTVLYSSSAARNFGSKSLKAWLFPVLAGTLMKNVLTRDANGAQSFLTVEAWWGTNKLGPNTYKGSRRYGVVFDSLSLSVDLVGAPTSVEVDFSGWINRRENIPYTETTPTPTFSTLKPFKSSGVFVDFLTDKTLETYGGHNADVRRFSLTFNNNGTVEVPTDNSTTPELDKVWTVHTPGDVRATFEVTVALNAEKYLKPEQSIDVVQGAVRLAFVHEKASKTTTTSTLTSGDNNDQTLLTAVTTGFAVGDVCFIQDTLGKFAVLPIKTVNAGVSLVFDTDTGGGTGYDSRVTLNGAVNGPLTIKNMTGGIIFDRLDFRGMSGPSRDSKKRAVTLRYEAFLPYGATKAVEAHWYDHGTAHV